MKKKVLGMWKKVRNDVRRGAIAATVICMMATVAFAEGETAATAATVTAAFTTGFQSMVNNALSMIAAIVPIALGMAGVTFLLRKAMSWFKTVAK